jgi:Fur family ferric uptake transcriptional regulator
VGEHQHVHLVCRSCGTSTGVDPAVVEPVAARLLTTEGFTVDIGHVSFFGVCANCREQS